MGREKWEGKVPAEPIFSANREVGKSAGREKDWAYWEICPPKSENFVRQW